MLDIAAEERRGSEQVGLSFEVEIPRQTHPGTGMLLLSHFLSLGAVVGADLTRVCSYRNLKKEPTAFASHVTMFWSWDLRRLVTLSDFAVEDSSSPYLHISAQRVTPISHHPSSHFPRGPFLEDIPAFRRWRLGNLLSVQGRRRRSCTLKNHREV